MEKSLLAILVVLVVFTQPHALPAFPGAQGWGTATPGGRGGKVYIVSNNNASGPGSFYNALQATGPRIIVFQVSGTISLPDYYDVIQHDFSYGAGANRSHVTIAGQTSPGGITLTAGSNGDVFFLYKSDWHDFVIRFIRFKDKTPIADVVELNRCSNFIFDHCDFAGGTDECFSLTESHHFTVQWCCIANSHPTSDQQYGSLFAYIPTSHISMHHNVWAHFKARFPQLHWNSEAPTDKGLIDYRNNIGYNYEGWAFHANYANGPVAINFVGNTFKEGRNTSGAASNLPVVTIYNRDNRLIEVSGAVNQNVANNWLSEVDQAFVTPEVTTQTATESYDLVLKNVGAWPRDAMTERTINDITTGSGDYGNLSEEFIMTGPPAPDDSDQDGMPNFWELAMGFNPNNANDQNGDHDQDGYTNIEEYLNDLAIARLCEPYANPVYPIPADWPDFDPSCSTSTGIIGTNSLTTEKSSSDLRFFPLPFSRKVEFQLSGSTAINYGPKDILRIVTIHGRIITTLSADKSVIWNRDNQNGNKVTAGIYLVCWMSAGKVVKTKEFILLP